MRPQTLIAILFLASACTLPSMFHGGGGGITTTTETSTNHSTREESVNGHPIAQRGEDDEDEAPHRSKKKPVAFDFGHTCRHNADCSNETCFVGRGELGYCTKMCSSWSECPSHWECERAGNSAQKICQQG